jgi:DNA-binding transcriptional regulator YiaG
MEATMTFDSERVRGIREALHLSRAQFANVYGFTERAVHAWENGQRTPDRASTLSALLKAERDAKKKVKA